MKKKLLSKLFLLLAILGGVNSAWAETEWELASWPSGETSFNGLTYWQSGSASTLPSSSTDKTTPSWGDESTYKTYIGTGGSSTFQLKNNVLSNTNRVFSFSVSASDIISVYFMGGGNGNRSMYLSYNASSTNRDASTSFGSATADGYTPTILTAQASSSGTVYLWCDANVRVYAIKLKSTTAPSISATDASVAATTSGVAATTNIDVIGTNLTGATLTATLNPAVEGLSVSLGSSTITNGTISTTATLSFTSTVNVAAATTTLTFSDGTTSKSVTVNYSAKVALWELQPVGEAITWNWEQTPFSSTEINFGLSEDYDPNTWYVMANIEGIDYPNNFDATRISFKGQYPTRNGLAQACTFKIHTTVPGAFTVTFSGTGSNASGRYVKVTDANREHVGLKEVSGTTHFSEVFKVVAGDVEITGTNALRFYKIEFVPVTYVSGTITESGYNTYSSNYPVDLSTISGGTAYVASKVEDGKVVLTKCTEKIPVGAGIMIAGEPDASFTIDTYAGDATFVGTNLFVGMPNGGEVEVATEGFNYVFGWTDSANPGFYKVVSDKPTLGAYKAYLHTTEALGADAARLALSFGDESTGINNVNVNENDNRFYDLMGRRVAQPQQGLYIVNGKRVIIK